MKQLDKQAFIEAKAQGKNNTEAALEAGAINKVAAYKAGYRLSKDTDIQKRITKSLTKSGVTIESLLQIYIEATQAEATDRETGEITPNYNVRMKAADKLLDLSGIQTRLKSETHGSHNTVITDTKELQRAIDQGDYIEMQRIALAKPD